MMSVRHYKTVSAINFSRYSVRFVTYNRAVNQFRQSGAFNAMVGAVLCWLRSHCLALMTEVEDYAMVILRFTIWSA